MDDIFDLSPLEQELEALSAIYLDELQVYRNENDQQIKEVELLLHPATGDDSTKKFVRMNLVFQPSSEYPDEVPTIVIRNPRGVGEEEIVSLVEDMREKALESVGEVMLYTLIEMAKEALTEGNIPHCPCVVCLEHFEDHDLFHRTACYHYFHTRCLHKYLEHSRDQIEQDKKEAEEHRHLNPQDEKEDVPVVCPVCRTPMDEDSLSVFCSDTEEEEEEHFIIPPNIREQQQWMAELYEKQKLKGSIIDIEWERNKFLINPDERITIPVRTASTENSPKTARDSNGSRNLRKDNGGPNSRIHARDNVQEGARNFGRGKGYSSSHHQERHRRGGYSRNDDYSHRQDSHYRDRRSGAVPHRRDGNEPRHSKYGHSEQNRSDDRMEKKQSNNIIRDETQDRDRSRLSSDAKSESSSNVSEELSDIRFVNAKSKNMADNEGRNYREDGYSGGRRGRGGMSYEGRHGRGRENRGGGGRDDSRIDRLGQDNWRDRRSEGEIDDVNDDRGRRGGGSSCGSGRGQNRNVGSSFRDIKEEFSDRRGSTMSRRRTYSDDEEDNYDSYEDDKSSRYSGNSQNSRSVRGEGRRRGGGQRGVQREDGGRGRGRRGIREGGRGVERGNGEHYDDMCSSKSGGAAAANYSQSSNNSLEHRNDSSRSRPDHQSDKKRYDYYNRDPHSEEHHQHQRNEYRGHDNQRNSSGRGGRRNEFHRHDDRRSQGFGRGRGTGGRGGDGTRSDQRRAATGEGEDEEEGRRKEVDLKNLEINQRWRELNFGVTQQDVAVERKEERFCVIDDDDNGDENYNYNVNDEDFDDDIRYNPNYKGKNLYAVASSESEEDWEKESDPFTFERRHIKREQFDEYTKYKKEHAEYYAKKVEKRAEHQNSINMEQRRILREQQQLLKNQRDKISQHQQPQQTSEPMSVLDRFKQSQKKKQEEEEDEDSGFSSSSKQPEETVACNGTEFDKGANGAEAAYDYGPRYDDDSSGVNDELYKNTEYSNRKSEHLPIKNKVEGIEWVGVRDQDDIGTSYVDGAAITDDATTGTSAFEESWKRRQEKQRSQRQKQRQMTKQNKKSCVETNDFPVNKHNSTCEKELLKDGRNNVETTRVRSRRRDTEKEKNALRNKEFVTFPGEIEKGECLSNGIAQVSSSFKKVEEIHSSHHFQAGNSQRKSKTKAHVKPLDLRKKNVNIVGHQTQHSSSSYDKNTIESLVEKFPSLLVDTDTACSENEKQEIRMNINSVVFGEDNGGILKMLPKNGVVMEARDKVETTSSSSNIKSGLPKESETVMTLKASNSSKRPKPLDFRKGVKKGL